MKIILLTHERELERPTNTGRLALELLPNECQRIMWSRVAPDETLVAMLATGEAKLLFPKQAQTCVSEELQGTLRELSCITEQSSKDSLELTVTNLPQVLVILDATWQEARKMYRQSSYLKNASTSFFSLIQGSDYQLRRNQVEGGLCTIECVIAIQTLLGNDDKVTELADAFVKHNSAREH